MSARIDPSRDRDVPRPSFRPWKIWPRRKRPAPAAFQVCPANEMIGRLEHERERADRSGRTLSLVVFSFPTEHSPEDNFRPLLDLLSKRLRTTDWLGWIDAQRLAAVLPYTAEAGALKVARDIVTALAETGPKPDFCIYCYPWTSENDGSSPPSWRPEIADDNIVALEPLLAQGLPWWKRSLDVAGALVGLALLSPVLLAATVAIRVSSPGPVLFCQPRSGLGGKPFTIYKFRTMVTDAPRLRQALLDQNEQDGPAFKIRNDPRVTRVGRFLRATSIDELPQLWNVLRGEMSLVGPRPLPCEESDACQGWRRRRLEVTPGITCIWQVRGRSSVSFDNWVRMDVSYIDSRSLTNDLRLIAETVPAVLFRKGAC